MTTAISTGGRTHDYAPSAEANVAAEALGPTDPTNSFSGPKERRIVGIALIVLGTLALMAAVAALAFLPLLSAPLLLVGLGLMMFGAGLEARQTKRGDADDMKAPRSQASVKFQEDVASMLRDNRSTHAADKERYGLLQTFAEPLGSYESAKGFIETSNALQDTEVAKALKADLKKAIEARQDSPDPDSSWKGYLKRTQKKLAANIQTKEAQQVILQELGKRAASSKEAPGAILEKLEKETKAEYEKIREQNRTARSPELEEKQGQLSDQSLLLANLKNLIAG
jgi:hypothetical protein